MKARLKVFSIFIKLALMSFQNRPPTGQVSCTGWTGVIYYFDFLGRAPPTNNPIINYGGDSLDFLVVHFPCCCLYFFGLQCAADYFDHNNNGGDRAEP